MSAVGDIIQPGQSIPDDVTAVVGALGFTLPVHPGDAAVQRLTVTAVREQPAASASGLCEVGADRVNCIVADPTHRRIYHGGSPLSEVFAYAGGMECPVCGSSEPHNAHEPAVEPRQADASPLLDLVQQYGDEREAVGAYTPNRGELQRDKAQRAIIAANMLLFHIAALAPALPVQARDEHGEPWWIHGCGRVRAYPQRPRPHACDNDTSLWRPLLVGGTWKPAKPGDTPGQLVPGGADEPQPVDLIAQVMAELGVDRHEDVLDALGSVQHIAEIAEHERDEARAEVERLKSAARVVEMADAIAAKLREIGPIFLDMSAQPDSLVLRLPEVPEGAVALVGERTGKRYPRRGDSVFWQDPARSSATTTLAEVLEIEDPGGVRVEMAPPREPRTWDELPGTPEGVRRVLDAHGQTWRHLEQGYWSVAEPTSDADRRDLRCFSELRELFGPLTEVLDDEPGGTASPEVQR